MSGRSARPGRGKRAVARSFYASAMGHAAASLAEAAAAEGVDDEIALLRLKLREAVEQRPEDFELLLKGVNALVRAVATRYRISPGRADDLAGTVAALLDEFTAIERGTDSDAA